jgi:hypothetical protein
MHTDRLIPRLQLTRGCRGSTDLAGVQPLGAFCLTAGLKPGLFDWLKPDCLIAYTLGLDGKQPEKRDKRGKH